MIDHLLQKIEESDPAGAARLLEEQVGRKGQAWEIHLSLFPVVQRVLNPPYINPHLPKMYRVYRELKPYLAESEIPALVRLEINEYARRQKLDKIPKPGPLPSSVSFKQVESAIQDQDREKAGILMAALLKAHGGAELARRLLLLGSNYLDQSLGHSLSCTAFILLEMLERTDQDPWPSLATLADYFCKGRFHLSPVLRQASEPPSDRFMEAQLLRAASGTGIVNLHQTITRYAIERVRHFFKDEEYRHLIAAWVEFMQDKKTRAIEGDRTKMAAPPDYADFRKAFTGLNEKSVSSLAAGMMDSEQGRKTFGRFLIRGVCELYQGDYNPHFLTGLGSFLWVMERYGNRPAVAATALAQYLNFFLGSMKGG